MIMPHYVLGAALLVTLGCTHIPGGGQTEPANLIPASETFVFQAEPAVIGPGETTMLRWNIQGATSVTIEESYSGERLHPLGTFDAAGTLKVQPREDATYVISCEGSTRVACASVSVHISVKRPQ